MRHLFSYSIFWCLFYLLLYSFGQIGVRWNNFPRKLQKKLHRRLVSLPERRGPRTKPSPATFRDLLQSLTLLNYYDEALKVDPDSAKQMLDAINELLLLHAKYQTLKTKKSLKCIPDIFQYYFSLSASHLQWKDLDPKLSKIFLSNLKFYFNEKGTQISSQTYLRILSR